MLTKKWELGWKWRGLGHGDYGIITEDQVLILPCPSKEIAEHIITLHNNNMKKQPKKGN